MKLTAYRLSAEAPPYLDLVPFARALVEARPDRLLWGSDWPHAVFKGRMPNTTDLFDLLIDWVPDETARRGILVENPAEALWLPALNRMNCLTAVAPRAPLSNSNFEFSFGALAVRYFRNGASCARRKPACIERRTGCRTRGWIERSTPRVPAGRLPDDNWCLNKR